MTRKELKKAARELNDLSKGKAAPEKGILEKAFGLLSQAGEVMAKGHVDLDAKDYENSNLDDMDNRPRRKGRRQVGDTGNQYSGMEPTDEEMEEWDEENEHRVIVTGKPEVAGGRADSQHWEDGDDPYVGPDHQQLEPRGGYHKSEYEEDEDAEKSEEDGDIKKSEAYVYEQLLESPEFTEIVESSPVIAHMADVMGKSYGRLAKRQDAMMVAVKSLVAANMALLAQLGATSKKAVDTGVIARPATNNDAAAPVAKSNSASSSKEDRRWHADMTLRLNEMAMKGDITPEQYGTISSRFDVQGKEALKSIPESVRKQYGIVIE